MARILILGAGLGGLPAAYELRLALAEVARAIDADHNYNSVVLASGRVVTYDYLVITTGPKLAFDEVPGLGPQANTISVCTTPHAENAYEKYRQFLDNPGPVVIGAAAGASCFGPAYEFALILDADLRRSEAS